MKLKLRLVLVFSVAILLDGLIAYIFLSSGASPHFATTIFLTFGVLCFWLTFNSMRRHFVSPFDLATMFVEKLTLSQFEIELPHLGEPEANRLMQALNQLMREMKVKEETIAKLETMRIDFVANVSHELKTPLTSIKGYTETLKTAGLDPAARDRFLERIEVNANRLEALISDLLSLSKLEKSGLELHWEIFDSHIFTEKLDATFLPSLARKKQTLKFDFKEARVEGDRLKLEQVFNNLIENACRYTSEGASILVKEFRDEQSWHYEVSDNGQGISPEHLPRIFERFYRVNPDRSRETGGTGLGLSIVKHAISAHGGTVEVQSKLGEGTKFVIRFPRRSL